jgi:dTDP-glucose 4,6-dehydratase
MKYNRKLTNILVTGGCGFIGCNFIRMLFERMSDWKGKLVNLGSVDIKGKKY